MLHYLGIPLYASYSLFNNQRWDVYLTGGFMAEVGVGGEQRIRMYFENDAQSTPLSGSPSERVAVVDEFGRRGLPIICWIASGSISNREPATIFQRSPADYLSYRKSVELQCPFGLPGEILTKNSTPVCPPGATYGRLFTSNQRINI